MDKTRIFVSSTCFDLSQIRRDIEEFIKSMEYEPIMSDSKDISIPPGLNNIEACKWLVRASDIFILIIGGRYGSTDSESGKSVTNIEYDTAYESGMPIYTFVDNEVWMKREDYNRLKDMVVAGEIPKGKIKNALGAKIEDPRVFEFINRVLSSQRDHWIYPFSQASEIIETLKRNLSLLFKQLLKTRKGDELFLYQTKLLPSLSFRWADSEGNPLETLSVKPLATTSLNKEKIIKKLKSIRPDDGDLKFIREKSSTILKLLIEREPEEIGLPERVDDGFISSAENFAKRIDSALELINST
jgi:hypothetical protein